MIYFSKNETKLFLVMVPSDELSDEVLDAVAGGIGSTIVDWQGVYKKR